MNRARAVAGVRRVRVHCRQFHRRHWHAGVVGPDDLPGLRVLDGRLAVGRGLERLLSGCAHEAGRPDVPIQVLAANRHFVEDGPRVEEVGEPVDPRQAGGGPPQEVPRGSCACAAALPRTPGMPGAT